MWGLSGQSAVVGIVGKPDSTSGILMTQILHITNVANLARIAQVGGLCSPNHMPASVSPSSSAHASIQDKRAQTLVPVGPGGVVHDYVPFYFGELSPMLFAIKNGRVQGVPADQRPMIYLVSEVESVAAQRHDWVFTDGHAIVKLTRFFDDLRHLTQVDWTMVGERYWRDNPDDPDRKRRKQAEFLVHRFFPLSLVTEIAVIDKAMAQQVQQVAGVTVPVQVRRDWYYY